MTALRTWWKSPRVRRVRRRLSDLQELLLYPPARLVGRGWAHSLHYWVTWSESGPLAGMMARGEPAILSAWHQDILPSMSYVIGHGVWRRAYPVILMVGDGRAGSLGGTAVAANGLRVVKGGKHTDGGRVGVVQRLAEECKLHHASAILTADGSRGPAFEAKWGAVYLARDTGFPLVPLRTVFSRGPQLKRTWAQFMVPPFPGRGRGHAASGEPIHVPPGADKDVLEACRTLLERRLNALIPLADAHLAGGTAPPQGHAGSRESLP